MNFLDNYVSTSIIDKIKTRYSKKTLCALMEREENVKKVLDYFKELGLNIETIVLNRLDLLLINYKHLKDKIDSYQQDLIIPALKDDISTLDYILVSEG